MGAVPEFFRNLPDALRSSHPAQSFTAAGPQAPRVIAEHQLEDGLVERSPLGALYALDAYVLLLGVGFESCTALHLAERRALGEKQVTVATGAPLLVDGSRAWVEFREPDVSSEDFGALGDDFQRSTRAIATSKVGMASSRLFSMRELVDFAVPWLARERS